MCEQGHIGLNEVAIGISVPLYWGRLMARIVGQKAAEHLCKFAVLLSPQNALKVCPSWPHCASMWHCVSCCSCYQVALMLRWMLFIECT